MYVFPDLDWNFKIPSLKLKPQSQKHTFYTVKCMFFQFWNQIIEAQSQKHTFYTVKCMFLGQGWFSEKACLDHANFVKTYILHCKMYVFPDLDWNFKIPSIKSMPQGQKHTFYTVKCMFFQIWTEISRFQASNWSPKVKNIHFTL